jgi:hypothetical protein
MERMPNIVKVEYQGGFMKVGMPDRYIIRQLARGFGTMIGDWGLCPSVSYQRDVAGTVIHQ